jgi:AraC-like DNA-binding protein
VRLVRLVDSPRDCTVLAPLAVREIVSRLALGDQRARLRQLALVNGGAHRIAKAVELLRKDYDKPLRIAAMARQLAMSVSAFHDRFKAATGLSPVSGWDNEPSHFSRDYERLRRAAHARHRMAARLGRSLAQDGADVEA